MYRRNRGDDRSQYRIRTGMKTPAKTACEQWMSFVSTPPPLAVPLSKQEWDMQRPRIRQQIWSLLGQMPPVPRHTHAVTISRQEREGCVLEKIQFDNGAGALVPGYLVLPRKFAGARPGILYHHWHGEEYSVGKEEVWRRDHTPEIPAEALAKRGYAVLAIDAYGFGERSGRGPGGGAEKGAAEELSASKFNLWFGRSLWGMIVRDDLMALNYLVSRPEVDPERIGATGISMGATRTWWLMALDDRIKAGAAIACLTRYQDLLRNHALAAHGIYYYVPGILSHFDTESVVALAAPRPLLAMTGDQDAGSPADGVREIGRLVAGVYRLHNLEANFDNRLYPGVGHACTEEMWRSMLDWMDRHLGASHP
jgi:dienelactone hydrolase